MNIHNKKELQSIAINHSANIDYKNFMNIFTLNVQVSHVLF